MEKKNRKIYCVRGAVGHANWMKGEIVKNMEEADLVVLPGGADVPYKYYADKGHPNTWGYNGDDEYQEIQKALRLGKHIWGTCKGFQWNAVINGCPLIQDMEHPYKHKIKTHDGKEFVVNSLHHQGIFPFNLPDEKYKILGWAENISPYHEDGNREEMHPPVEPEIVYFPETKMLGAQFHMESISPTEPVYKYCQELLDKFLEDKL